MKCFLRAGLQFDLHFRKQDQIKVILKNLTINSKSSLKYNTSERLFLLDLKQHFQKMI